jgi:hypothetical protein
MPVYQYEGKHYDLPDGLSNEQAIAKIEAHLGIAPKAATPASQIPGQSVKAPAARPTEVSTVERMFGAGSPIARTVKGAIVDPALAVNQLLANTGLFGETVRQGANQLVRNVESTTQAGRERIGSAGFDPYQLLGAVVSPANRLVGLTQPAAVSGLGQTVARSAATGAGLSALQPVTAPDEQFAEKKLQQMGVGAVLGPLTEGGVKAISSLAGLVKGLTPKGREEALNKYVNELAGPDSGKVISALQDAKELVSGSRPTVAQALADIPSAAELIAAQRKLSSKTGLVGKFAERAAEQQAARVRAIEGIAGTEAQRAALATERATVTGTMRETALDQADVAGPIFSRLEKEIADGFNSVAAAEQTVGMVGLASRQQQATAMAGRPGWLTAGDIAADASNRAQAYSRKAQTLRSDLQLKQFQKDSLETNGFFPLRAQSIVDQIDAAIRGTTSDMSKQALQGVREKIISKADENGVLSSRDLYENVRKTLNQDIAKYLNLGEQYASGGLPQQAAKSAESVKKFIDASLDRSSDNLWSKYLKSYTDYSGRLNRMEIGNFLSQRLQTPLDKERAGVFATAVENAAATIKKSTGIPRYNKLSDVLTPQETATVNGVLADLKRANKADELSRKLSKLPEGLKDATEDMPQLLSRPITVLRAALELLQKGNATEFNKRFAELSLDPQGLALFMTTGIPKGKIDSFVSSLMKVMDDPTRSAFIQSFTVPAAAETAGQ